MATDDKTAHIDAKTSTESGNNEPKQDSQARDTSYFHYYSLLTHQQNMLQDSVRTSTYQKAILKNPDLYQGKLVMDVGAGSGILSYFAVQAGASVIAIEASNMALKMKKLISASELPEGQAKNPWLRGRVTVINKKIEDVELDNVMVDTIISEPIGVLLVHERMPGGAMVPSSGTIHLAPFTDANLWNETMTKARFWNQSEFYGVDLSPLEPDAREEAFGMPVVGYFDANSLMTIGTACHAVDFNTVTLGELQAFEIPFSWVTRYTGLMHGIATWFDLFFNPPSSVPVGRRVDVSMSTGPHAERTHWQQARLLLDEPLAVNAGQLIQGTLTFAVNPMRSYDLTAKIELFSGTAVVATRTSRWGLQEQTYNYSYLGPTVADFKPEQLMLYEPVAPASDFPSMN